MIAGNSRKSRKNRMDETKPPITQENISRHVITHLAAKNVIRGIWKRIDVANWANGDSDLVEAVMKLAESKKEVANFKRV
jgi:hypothetical protein